MEEENLYNLPVGQYFVVLYPELGSGTFGTVYKATDAKNSDAKLAVKRIKCKHGLETNTELTAMANNEAKYFQLLKKHDNFVKFLDFKFCNDDYWIFMEFCELGDLPSYFNTKLGEVNLGFKIGIVHQLADAMAYMHNRKLVHRDLKPKNVLVKNCGSRDLVKITDFGCTKMFDDQVGSLVKTQQQSNYMHTVAGTAYFMAPEFFHETVKYKPSIDTFALGLVFKVILEFDGSNRDMIPLSVHNRKINKHVNIGYEMYVNSKRNEPLPIIIEHFASDSHGVVTFKRLITHMVMFHHRDRPQMQTVLEEIDSLLHLKDLKAIRNESKLTDFYQQDDLTALFSENPTNDRPDVPCQPVVRPKAIDRMQRQGMQPTHKDKRSTFKELDDFLQNLGVFPEDTLAATITEAQLPLELSTSDTCIDDFAGTEETLFIRGHTSTSSSDATRDTENNDEEYTLNEEDHRQSAAGKNREQSPPLDFSTREDLPNLIHPVIPPSGKTDVQTQEKSTSCTDRNTFDGNEQEENQLGRNESTRSFQEFGCDAKQRNDKNITMDSDINVNFAPTSIENETPEIRKYKKKINSDILCASLWGVNLLIGTDSGLQLLDRSGQGKVYMLISRRRFRQMEVLEGQNILVTISGKHDKIRIYYLSFLKTKILKSEGVNTLTVDKKTGGYTKLGDLEGAVHFKIVKYERIKFLVIAMKESIEIYAWAPKPYHKFMAFKSFNNLPEKPLLVDLTVEEGQRLKVIYGSNRGFHAIDLDTSQVFDIYIPSHSQYLVTPHTIVILPNTQGMQLLLCYDNEGVYVDTYGKITKNVVLQWGELPTSVAYISTGQVMGWGHKAIEIRSAETGHLDGVFMHKKAQKLKFLCERNDKVFFSSIRSGSSGQIYFMTLNKPGLANW